MKVELQFHLLLQNQTSPAVIDDFKDVQEKSRSERLINEAQAYANELFKLSEASKIRESASLQEVIAVADGDPQRFLSVYKEHKDAKDVIEEEFIWKRWKRYVI